jgi:TonB family protein
MSRLQKKCFIASTGLHLLLAFILIVGPAFLLPESQPRNLPTLDFVPVKTVDALISGGGNPKAQPPAPAPLPAPQPPAPAVVTPPPQPKPESESLEVAKERKHKIEVSTKVVTRKPTELADAKAAADRRAQEDARRQRAANAIGQAVRGIATGLSGSTTIELKGPGGGGVPYANWLQAVNTAYQQAWIVPAGLTADTPAVSTSVTIARDGTVISAKIIRFSRNPDADQSVEAVLNRVRQVAPLPDDAREDERTVTIHFINDRARI